MTNIHKLLSLLVLLVVFGLAGVAATPAVLTQPAAPTARATANGGEMTISWSSIPGAQYYTIGWVNWTEGQPIHTAGGDWHSLFHYTTVRGGETTYTVKGLNGGDNHHAIIRATDVNDRFGGGYSGWSGWSPAVQPAGQHGDGFCPITGLPLPPGGYLSIGSAAVFGKYSVTVTSIEAPASVTLTDADGNQSDYEAPSGRRWFRIRIHHVNNYDSDTITLERGKDYVLSTDAGNAFSWSTNRAVEAGSQRSDDSLLFDIPADAITAVFAIRPYTSTTGANSPQLYEISIPARATSATLVPASNTPLTGQELTRHVKPALAQIVATNSHGETGTGTGFVVGSNGIMITNRHVVDDAQTVEVRMNTLDGRTERLTGTVLGRGILADLAAVQLPSGRTYSALPLADSDAVFGTDEVTAWGYPVGGISGSYPTVTRGIISSKRVYGDLNFLQTDAAINPGNSGGPLIDQFGNVVGVNTLGTPVDIAQDQGFSIASNEVKARLTGLITGGPNSATYRNLSKNYGYSVNIPRNWYLHSEGDFCTWFQSYDRTFSEASICTWSLERTTNRSADLDNLASDVWDDWLAFASDAGWPLIQQVSRQKMGASGQEYYRIKWQARFGADDCVTDETLTVVLSSSYPSVPRGFDLNAGVCQGSSSNHIAQRDGIINSFRW